MYKGGKKNPKTLVWHGKGYPYKLLVFIESRTWLEYAQIVKQGYVCLVQSKEVEKVCLCVWDGLSKVDTDHLGKDALGRRICVLLKKNKPYWIQFFESSLKKVRKKDDVGFLKKTCLLGTLFWMFLCWHFRPLISFGSTHFIDNYIKYWYMHNRKIISLLLHGIVGTGTHIFNRCESFGNVWVIWYTLFLIISLILQPGGNYILNLFTWKNRPYNLEGRGNYILNFFFTWKGAKNI